MLQQAIGKTGNIVGSSLELTVVIPTLNEAGNIEPLLDRISNVLGGIEWEAIFVDDGSTDGTPELLTKIAQVDRRVRLIRRIGRRGLSSAVVEGALASTSPVVAVIDADLQHDEKILPDLYRALKEGDHELAIGTRYAGNGSTGDWDDGRRIAGCVRAGGDDGTGDHPDGRSDHAEGGSVLAAVASLATDRWASRSRATLSSPWSS